MWVVFFDSEGREVWVKLAHIGAVGTVDNDLGAIYVSSTRVVFLVKKEVRDRLVHEVLINPLHDQHIYRLN